MVYPDFKVCVRCFTFNQAKYIEETMNGFTMQQTNFPFVCCIVDDASTDGEQEVLKSYMKTNFNFSSSSVSFEKDADYAFILFAQHNENVNCYFAVLLLKENLYSSDKSYLKFDYIAEWREKCEYEAICEGDDFWIDKEKLSKQVSFLDSHPDYGFSYAKAYSCNELGLISKKYTYGQKKESFEELIEGNTIPTLTVIYRIKLHDSYRKVIKYNSAWRMGDYPMWLFFILHSKVKFFDYYAGVYRDLMESASHSRSLRKKICFIHGTFLVRRDFSVYAKRRDLLIKIISNTLRDIAIACAYKIALVCKIR